MPLVRIDTMNASEDKLYNISEALQRALTETMGFPSNDLFHIAQSHNPPTGLLRYGNYLNIDRDENIVYVQVFLREGRKDEEKRSFYARAAELAGELAGVDSKNLFIVLTENQSIDWSLGQGLAQYAPAE